MMISLLRGSRQSNESSEVSAADQGLTDLVVEHVAELAGWDEEGHDVGCVVLVELVHCISLLHCRERSDQYFIL